jgi:glycosyltransferase involved in cell wall biosynthesis
MTNSLRVLLISNSNEIGGGNRSLETLCLGLRQNGHSPFIVFPEEGPAPDLFRNHGLTVIINALKSPSIKAFLATVKSYVSWNKIIKKHCIDLIHANGSLAARSVTLSAKTYKKPMICHIRYDFGADYYQWAFKYIPSPDCFIFVSQSMENSIKPALITSSPAANFKVVHNAVILSDKAIPAISEKVGRIGIIANFQEVKGHEDFFNMAKNLLKSYPYLQFDVIGSDIQNEGRENILRNLITELQIEKNVTFHGHLTNIYPVIDALDLVICPSHEEPFGRCAIEAMSRGKPVVVTNVGGLPEIVEENVNGFVVPSKNPEALIDAVTKLIEDIDLRQTMSCQNVDKVHTHFSQMGHTQSILNLYNEVINFQVFNND